METTILNFKGEEVGKVDLPADLFGIRPSVHFLHEVITSYLNNRRRWTAHTKTRSEVRGGGHKPWKQKHTGRARAGSNRSPLWRKGGVAFGPRYVDPKFKHADVPSKKSRLALAQALSVRAAQGRVRIVDGVSLDGAKTRQVTEALQKLGVTGNALMVVDHTDRNLRLASRNIAEMQVVQVSQLNAYEVLRYGTLLLTRAALDKIRSRWN